MSSRLETVAKDSHSRTFYVNSAIKSENLKYNLTGVLSKIILKLQLTNGTKKDFMQTIELYNSLHKTKIKYGDFTAINWITESDQETVIPERLRNFLFRIGHDRENGKTVTIPVESKGLIEILQLYYNRFYLNRRLLISSKDLAGIVRKGHPSVKTAFLLEKGIVEKTKDSKSYQWMDSNQYVQHLGSEIAAILWDEFGGETSDYESFRQYYSLIRAAGLWPVDLKNYLTQRSCASLINLSIKFLYNQQDLKQSASEFSKIWMNAADYMDRGSSLEIPVIAFDYSDAYSFIKSIKSAEFLFPDIFYFQSTRNHFLLLLHIIIENTPEHPNPHENVLKLIQNLELPIVAWNSIERIPTYYPQLIPFLLTDTDLAPLAFQLIDKIKINENFSPDDSNERNHAQNREEINGYWMEMFTVFLEKSESISAEKEKIGTALARILGDLAMSVFTSGGRTANNRTDHMLYRKRLENVIKKLSTLRLSNSHSYGAALNPRIIFSYLPVMAEYISDQILLSEGPDNGYLRMNSAWTSLGIEMLKLINLRSSEAEITKAQRMALQDSGSMLTGAIKDYLVHYYTVQEINIAIYDEGKTKVTVSRTEREFGFEIIDWGYLTLCLEKETLLENLDSKIIGSLNFLKKGDKYDRQNKDQSIKLKLYIKLLLLAYLEINENENKNEYDIQGLPVYSVKEKLEKWIIAYALCYSVEDMLNGRTDIFNELYSSFGYLPYHIDLADLLYRCIAYFTIDRQEKFVKDYVGQNSDISRLLAAINIFEKKNLQEIVSDRISKIDVGKYIASKFMITDLEYALREAIISENHWELAEELLLKVQSHYKGLKGKYENSEDFLFEINLLLAYRQKQYDKLKNLEIPEKKYRIQGENKKSRNLKNYYIALFEINNRKNYDKAIEIFQELQSDDPKNIRYAFQLYRAQTLKAIDS